MGVGLGLGGPRDRTQKRRGGFHHGDVPPSPPALIPEPDKGYHRQGRLPLRGKEGHRVAHHRRSPLPPINYHPLRIEFRLGTKTDFGGLPSEEEGVALRELVVLRVKFIIRDDLLVDILTILGDAGIDGG